MSQTVSGQTDLEGEALAETDKEILEDSPNLLHRVSFPDKLLLANCCRDCSFRLPLLPAAGLEQSSRMSEVGTSFCNAANVAVRYRYSVSLARFFVAQTAKRYLALRRYLIHSY